MQLGSIGVTASPIFFQYVTDNIMKAVLKEKFPIPTHKEDPDSTGCLDYEEINALRYTAGYVVKSLLQKMKRSKHKEIVLCLADENFMDKG